MMLFKVATSLGALFGSKMGNAPVVQELGPHRPLADQLRLRDPPHRRPPPRPAQRPVCWQPKSAKSEADQFDRSGQTGLCLCNPSLVRFILESMFITRIGRGTSSPAYKYKGMAD